MWWDEWGCSIENPRAALPRREYHAHLAILRGRARKRAREKKKADAEKRKASRKVS